MVLRAQYSAMGIPEHGWEVVAMHDNGTLTVTRKGKTMNRPGKCFWRFKNEGGDRFDGVG